MHSEDVGVDGYFMQSKNYITVSQQSKRRNILLNNYLDIIEEIFIAYRQFYEENQEAFKIKVHEKNPILIQFKKFLNSFSDIMKQTSILQIDCITEAKISSQDLITEVTEQIVQKIQIFSKPQRKLKNQIEQLNSLRQNVVQHYSTLKNQAKDPYVYFNSKYMLNKSKNIKQQLQNLQKLQQNLQKNKIEVSLNVFEFEKYLFTFRKKLLQNKYYSLGKMKDYSKHFRDCLMQIMLFLGETIVKKSQQFTIVVKKLREDPLTMSTQSRGKLKAFDQEELIAGIINSVKEYNLMLQDVERILHTLDQSFKKLLDKVNRIMNNKVFFMDNLNNLYDLDENPSKDVVQTLDLFSSFTQKMCLVSDKIYNCTKKLTFLKTNVKKHTDVTLSLLRMKIGKSSLNDNGLKIDQLYDQISPDFITDILNQVYQSFRQTFSGIKNYFNQKFYKKKKKQMQNSMDLSHFEDTVFAPKKKPCKKERWLWRDYRDKNQYNFQSTEGAQKDIAKFLASIELHPQSPENKKFQCILQAKNNIKGVLKICENYLQFISFSSHNIDLLIPFSDIQQISSKVKVFEKILNVKTSIGEIHFSKFLDIEASRIYIIEKLEGFVPEGKTTTKKKTVKLSEEQTQFIIKRLAQIQPQLPITSDLKKLQEKVMNGVTVDQVYDTIYSDKPFNLRGKPEQSFFAYIMKKSKNFNYTSIPFTPNGPEFYTGIKDRTFQNCTLFSSRICQYDHPIPPIPFMPKFCHCKQNVKIYWVSHERFIYECITDSSGAPYSDTFKVKVIHQISKQNDGVKIQIYGLLYFVKQTAMKGMVQSKGDAQMAEAGGSYMISEIQKTLKILAGISGKGPQAGIDLQLEDQNNSQTSINGKKPKSQVDKLKNQNKLLVGCLIGVIILNILLKIILN